MSLNPTIVVLDEPTSMLDAITQAGQKFLVGIECEMLNWVVGEIPSLTAVADHKKLHEAEQTVGVAVARIFLIIDNLLHGPPWADLQTLQLDLHQRQAAYEQDHVIAMKVAV